MAVGDVAFLTGRVLFAVVVGYLALGNLLDFQASVGYARSKASPSPASRSRLEAWGCSPARSRSRSASIPPSASSPSRRSSARSPA
jgi:hypothetical protein